MAKKLFHLYELKKGAKIIVNLSDGSKYAIFDHMDGMYSYCLTEKGGVAHLSTVLPLLKFGKTYQIAPVDIFGTR